MRRNHSKSALVLAGGGLTGAVYEIGALRAIDDLLVDRTVNDFDVYVGTSAGAFVAALLANGVSPQTMFEVINGSHPGIRPIERQDLFSFNREGILRSSLRLPRQVLGALSNYVGHFSDMTLFDFVWSLSEAIPSALYDNLALERYLRESLDRMGFSNRFDELARELYIIATNLDDGERTVFCRQHSGHVPISKAVAASSAMPLFYKPILIDGKEYVDGGLRGNASLDLAIEQGARLVVCINPVVPFRNEELAEIAGGQGKSRHLSERGVQAIASQMLSILLHSGLHYHVKQLRRRFRDVDIILIEPQPNDEIMHFYNIMRYSARLSIAQHGFESVTLDLAEDFSKYKRILARHDVPVTRRLLAEEMNEIWDSDYDPRVLRRILYGRRPARFRNGAPIGELSRSLAELDLLLDQMSEEEALTAMSGGRAR